MTLTHSNVKFVPLRLVIDQSGSVGTILDDDLTIACGKGALRPTRIQRPGKSVMDTKEVLRGYHKLACGVVLDQ